MHLHLHFLSVNVFSTIYCSTLSFLVSTFMLGGNPTFFPRNALRGTNSLDVIPDVTSAVNIDRIIMPKIIQKAE